MALLTNRDAALRLAEALVADVRLYHEAALREGALPPEVVDEARALYRARVDPALHPEFETVFAAFYAAHGLGALPAPRANDEPAFVPPSLRVVPAEPASDEGGLRIALGAGLLVLLLFATAALMAYFVRR